MSEKNNPERPLYFNVQSDIAYVSVKFNFERKACNILYYDLLRDFVIVHVKCS